MNEDPFGKQEQLVVRLEIATEKDLQTCKDLRLMAINGEDSKMFGPEIQLNFERAHINELWHSGLFGSDVFVLLAWKDSQAIGMGIARKVPNEDIWSIGAGYVKPGFRGGIGKKIFAARINEIKRRGGKKIEFSVRENNQTMIKMAESFGCKRITKGNSLYYELDNLEDPKLSEKINSVINAR